jgi:hypothetical protein
MCLSIPGAYRLDVPPGTVSVSVGPISIAGLVAAAGHTVQANQDAVASVCEMRLEFSKAGRALV